MTPSCARAAATSAALPVRRAMEGVVELPLPPAPLPLPLPPLTPPEVFTVDGTADVSITEPGGAITTAVTMSVPTVPVGKGAGGREARCPSTTTVAAGDDDDDDDDDVGVDVEVVEGEEEVGV